MALLCPLGSGSNGNSCLVRCGDTAILVDAGLSSKAICAALDSLDCGVESLDAILLTHEHSDHVKALPVLLKKLSCPVYGPAPVLDYLSRSMKLPAHTPLVPLEEGAFVLHDLEVLPFTTPHDSIASVGYRFQSPEGRYFAIATDLGHVSPQLLELLAPCQALLLESNYDEGMLLCSPYPYPLKRRIASPMGHLSNGDCAAAAVQLAQGALRSLILGHLSQNNNLPELAYGAVKSALDLADAPTVELRVALRSQCSQPLLIP